MKYFALLLCCLSAYSALPNRGYVENEFMLRVSEHFTQNQHLIPQLIRKMQTRYNYEVLNMRSVGSLKFLHLRGDDKFMSEINSLEGVKYIERNNIGELAQVCEEQSSPGTWGLDRIDQRAALPYSDPVSDDATYIYGERTGSDVVAYVMDTGIDVSHPDFEGRATWEYTAPGMSDSDGHGHGTHCSGTVGGASYGVAKDVQLVAVRVADDLGFSSSDDFVGGVEYILADHAERQASLGAMPKSLLSASLRYVATQAIDDAVQEAVNAGVVSIVAAGNDNLNACNVSPARVLDAIVVGATNIADTSAWFTNYGSCVDLFAPGVDVLSALPDNGSDAWSGTSMATPHVAGVVARYQSALVDAPTPQGVSDYLVSTATQDAITWFNDNHASSENLLLYADC